MVEERSIWRGLGPGGSSGNFNSRGCKVQGGVSECSVSDKARFENKKRRLAPVRSVADRIVWGLLLLMMLDGSADDVAVVVVSLLSCEDTVAVADDVVARISSSASPKRNAFKTSSE